ncbi:amino acid adenylation domain-containing protein [Tateyamaria sp. SN3-11]|uniref:amino acid adenylation domain-containing protein n=1 Tax=Tateyamaria sp. SN3-11 TaxID=3092147 RepID=UPI0039EC2BDF
MLQELAGLGIELEANGDKLRIRGPASALDADMRTELKARKAEILAHFSAPKSPVAVPLLPNQRRLWFIDKLTDGATGFALQAAFVLPQRFSEAVWQTALDQLCTRHPILCTRLQEVEDTPHLQLREGAVTPECHDTPLPDDRPDYDALRPTSDALFRCTIWPRGAAESLVVLSLHHMISDRQSMSLVIEDLLRLLAGQTPSTQGLDYLDVMAGADEVQQDHSADELSYWTEALRDAPSELALPFDRARPERRGAKGAVHQFALPKVADLRPLAQRNNATAFVTYLSVYAQLLSRWSGQQDLVIGCPVSGRYLPGTEATVGYFVNTVALRLDLERLDIASIIERARAVVLGAMEHQNAAFDQVVSALSPERHLNRNPLFQAMFVLQPPGGPAPAFDGRPIDILPAPPLAPDVDVSLTLEETAQGYAGYLEYDPDLFDPDTITLFADQFSALCHDYAGADSEHQALAHWVGVRAPRPSGDMWDVLGERLRSMPADRAVLEDDQGVVTVAKLMDLANAVAAGLVGNGVATGDTVGISLARTRDRVAAMLGVWQARATVVFLPVEGQDKSAHQLCAERIERGGIGYVICADGASADFGQAHVLPMAGLASAPEVVRPDENRGAAYLCFTSGTTGTAKAVAVSQAGLINHMLGIADLFVLTPQDRVLQFAPASFDMVFEDMLPALAAGACLVVPEAAQLTELDQFQAMLNDTHVTVANLPAPFWHAWVHELSETASTAPDNLRLVITGSDLVHGEAAQTWRTLCPQTALLSGYGLTETTITALVHRPAQDPGAIASRTLPLGAPLPNVSVSILDADGMPVPSMVVGEIAISGAAVAMGYHGVSTDPRFRQGTDGPQFMTGDLGRMRRDGQLEFLGRRDQQIKIRGVRVEPSAVEVTVASLAGVSEAAVVARPTPTGQWGLAAFVVGTETPDHYTEHLRRLLPAAMVPQSVVVLPDLPRTPSGKIDRRALARKRLDAPAKTMRPPTSQEARLAAIFADVLGQKRVGPDDNFFALGGDSITSLQIVARARRAGFALTAAHVFEHQTVAALAAHVTNLDRQDHGETRGPIPATPILAWFATQFDQPWRQFNQSVMLALPEAVDADALRVALGSVADAHPIFALRVDPGAAAPFSIADTAQTPAFHVHETEHGQDAAMAELQASLDPAEGHNVAALLLPAQNRLLLTIHHLCIDVLSWDVLLRDLETAYDAACTGKRVEIRPAGAPFRAWAERLQEFAKGNGIAGTVSHFMQSLGGPVDPIFGTPIPAGQDKEITSIRLSLPAGITSDLLRHAAVAYELRADEALLVGLMMAQAKRGANGIRVDLERNGRASPFEDLDLADTIGWFTSVMPLRLEAGEDVEALAKQVRRATQDSPHEGLGFGMARYCGTDATRAALESLPEADVLLNYVGVLSGWTETAFRPVDADCGPTIAPETRRSHVLEINAGVVAGQMRIELVAPHSAHAQAAALAQHLELALSQLAAQARRARFGLELGEDVEDVLLATPLQHRILLHSMRRPETYFDQLRFTIDGPLDWEIMQRSWDMVQQRHKALRTTFGFAADDRPLQIVHRTSRMAWHSLDWRDLPKAEAARLIPGVMDADRAKGFDVEAGPLMRMHVVRLTETHYEWIWSAHHLVLDGWSVSVVMQDWQAIYAAMVKGDAPQLAPAADPSDYAAWLDRLDLNAARDYWADHLTGADATFVADSGTSDPAAVQAPGTDRIDLGAQDQARLGDLARDLGSTVGTIAQAAWALVLRRYGHSGPVLFGLTVSNRPPEVPGAENLVGMMINTLPVRVDIDPSETPRGLLAQMTAQARARAASSALSLDDILEAGGFGGGSLPFDSMMLVQNYPRPASLSVGDLDIGLAQVAERTDLPLTLVVQSGEDPCLMAVWDRARIDDTRARAMLRHWHAVIQSFLADVDQSLGGVSVYSGAELAARIALAQGPRPDTPVVRGVEAAEHWARILPDHTALVADDAVLTYQALNAAVAHLGAQLKQAGLAAGAPVAVVLPRSARAIVSILAVMRAGGVAVPVDTAYPQDRIDYILADSGADLVITQADVSVALGQRKVVLCDRLAVTQPPTDAAAHPSPDMPAYVIYTSGSTGQPKGTITHHGGLDNMIAAQRHAFDIGPADRALQFASLSFDASIWETFMALASGATLFVPSRDRALGGRELAEYLRDQQITAATLPPTVIGGLPETDLSHLALLVAAGEACPQSLIDSWGRERRFFNAYGPSEASVCATLHHAMPGNDAVPIGAAIAGAVAYVTDPDGHLVPAGGTGELVIGGAGVGLGYHGRPELTARAFGTDPWGQDARARIYRTGDRVEVVQSGSLMFRGRLDRQIKLRGFRIEPGEIESALVRQASVARALVGARSTETDDMPRLMAWVMPAEGAVIDPDALREDLGQHLPTHMVPSAVLAIDAIPLTPNGKVDWAALPDATEEVAAPQEETAPIAEAPQPAPPRAAPALSPQERIIGGLTDIWAELLDGRRVAPDQNFFDAGGHSLLLVRMQPMLKEAFDIQVRTRTLFDNLTIGELAEALLDAGAKVPDVPEPTLAETGHPTSSAQPQAQASEPIAVIGMACRFPGADGLDAFWDMLRLGKEGLSDLARADLEAAGECPKALNNPAYVARRGIIAQADSFDAEAFGIGPSEAQLMDPQHRLFLECVWHALEDAGHAPRQGANTGVFAGAGYNTWLNEVLRPAGHSITGAAGYHAVTANEKDFLATQTAFRLDLRGPAVSVQTACSTSLVAVIQAVQALRAGLCDTAIAGGVSMSFPAHRGYIYEPDMILSPDGHCRPFGAQAAGTVPSSGVGAVVLKPLSEAQDDGDRIYAVIRGTGLGNDGARKMSFAAPGVDGQTEAMRAALDDAGLEPGDVDALEAHGTGTALGDPVEMTAIARVFADRKTPLSIGSVKSNIGHADAAAGIAGFIKTALGLWHGAMPPSLHAEVVNPRLDLADGALRIASDTVTLNETARAGVSSFGIGGTNAHVLLETAPTRQVQATDDQEAWHILPVSGPSVGATADIAQALGDRLAADSPPIAGVAATLQSGRAALSHRSAVLARGADRTEATQNLRTAKSQEARGVRPAFLFAGQGSQHLAMGKALYDQFPTYRACMDDIDTRLRPLLGRSLHDLILSQGDDSQDTLRYTRFAQPAVFAVSVATARLWQELGATPGAVLGHSVGEFAAAHIAGVMDLDEALRLIVARSALVADQPAGGMLAATLGADEATAYLSDGVEIAALNGPRQVVFAGPHAVVDALKKRLAQDSIPCQPLATSHAFHSAMLAPARDAFKAEIDTTKLSTPNVPFASTVTGTWVDPGDLLAPAYWADQICNPVRCAEALAALSEDGPYVGLDMGPGATMTALAAANGISCLTSHDVPQAGENGADAPPQLLSSLADLWCKGASVNWQALHAETPQKAALPLMPFARTRHAPSTVKSGGMHDLPPKRADMGSWFYRPDLEPVTQVQGARITGPVLIVSDRPDTAAGFLSALLPQDVVSTATVADVTAQAPEQVLNAEQPAPTNLIFLLREDPGADWTVLQSVLVWARHFVITHGAVARGIRLVTQGAVPGAVPVVPMLAALRSAFEVMSVEHPEIAVSGLDLVELPDTTVPLPETGFFVWKAGGFFNDVPVATECPEPTRAALPDTPRILITGGFGGVGRALSDALADAHPGAELVLTSRGDHSASPVLDRLRNRGAVARAVQIDVSEGQAVASQIAELGPFDLVIHAAGCADHGGVLARRDGPSVAAVLAPKIAGLEAIAPAVTDKTQVVLCSTLGAWMPDAKFGQAAYAAANGYLDAAAIALSAAGHRAVAINWDDWVGAGMTEAARTSAGEAPLQAEDGLTAAEGAAALMRILAAGQPRVAVSVRDLHLLMRSARARFADGAAHKGSQVQNPSGQDRPGTLPNMTPAEIAAHILSLFRDVLGRPDFQEQDNFFEQGGIRCWRCKS